MQEEIASKIKAKEEEQAKRKALEEKGKNMTDEEIQAEIEKIDRETFDLKQKYKRIIEFQIAIAKARGLIGDKETMQGEDMAYLQCQTSEVPSLIKELNASTIFNNAMIGVDDDRKTSIIMITKVSEGEVYTIRNSEKWKEEYKGYTQYSGGNHIGTLNMGVLKLIPLCDRDHYFIRKYKGQNLYDVYLGTAYSSEYDKERMKGIYQKVKEQDDDNDVKQDIKFSIQLPLQRSLLPIIEQLKQAGIEFYIPPVDIPEFEFKKVTPSYRIYIDRQYLKKYKEQVHPELFKRGAVIIENENPKLSEMLLQDCEFPYGLDKEREH